MFVCFSVRNAPLPSLLLPPAIKAAGSWKPPLRSVSFPPLSGFSSPSSLCLAICVRPLFLPASLSLLHTHTHTHTPSPVYISVCSSFPYEQCVTELSELTNDSPLHSHLPPLITHPHFLTASLPLFVFCSPHHFHFASLKLAAFFILEAIKLYWRTGKIQLYSLLPRQTMTAEYNVSDSGLQSHAKT